MPAKLPTHRPARPHDAGQQQRVQARRAARFLPYSGPQWQSIRRAQLERFPLCEDCGDAANEVDHNTNDTSRNLIGIELSSLCKPCHSRRTNARMQHRVARGCDVHGNPLSGKSLEGDGHNTGRPASHASPQMRGPGHE